MRYAPLFFLVVALLGAGTYLESNQALQPLKRALQSQSVHRSAFPGNRTVRVLNRLGVLHPEPTSALSREERLPSDDPGRDGALAFWSVGPVDPERIPSTTLVPAEARDSPLPLMSVYVEQGGLKKIWENPLQRGRAWERSAFVSYFEHGRLRFGSGAGIRIHGGRSRLAPQQKSFRLYFRETYGVRRFPPGILFDPASDPIRHLVLHGDLRHYYKNGGGRRLTNPLAYDFARRLGALAPRTQPIIFWLNGRRHGLYMLTEHLDGNYLQSHYGHQLFTMVRTKFDQRTERTRKDDPIAYLELVRFAQSARWLSLDDIGGRVDLDNLSRWFISLLICGTTDPFQGPALLDETRPEARWFWINWDMDHSFTSPKRPAHYEPWEVDLFHQIVFEESLDPRSVLLHKLIEYHPAYRSYLLNLYTEAINHRLTQEFIEGRLQHYERVARAYGLPDVAFIDSARDYLARREPILRERMGRFLKGGAERRVTLIVPAGRTVEVDGHPKSADYEGWYYDTVPIRLDASAAGAEFAHWSVDGEQVPEPEIELEIDQDTGIEAVFAPAPLETRLQ